MSYVKKLCICAFCIALCLVLPMALHPLGLGALLSPMHIPVLLCGLLCGWPYGALCGIVGPILSSILSGMPPATGLISMVPELCAYGLFAGLILKFAHTGRLVADLYLALVPAMVLGRVVGGVARALFYLYTAQPYSVALWVSGYFVETLPGAVVHLILIPALVLALTRARLVPSRYALSGAQAG